MISPPKTKRKFCPKRVIIRFLTSSSSSTIELVRGTTTDANHDWKLGNYAGDFIIKKSVNSVETDTLIKYKNQQNGRDIFYLPDADLNVEGTIYTGALSSTGNISAGSYLQGSGGGGAFRIIRSDNWVRLMETTQTTHLDLVVGQLYTDNLITTANGLNVSGLITANGGMNITSLTATTGFNTSTSDVYADMVIRNTNRDKCMYINYASGTNSVLRLYSGTANKET